MLSTVVRAGNLLDLFTLESPEWGATSVAAALGVTKSQAHELLMSLAETGLLRRSDRGRYRLGWRALELGRDALRSQFSDEMLPLMRRFARHFREPVELVGLDRDIAKVIARQRGGCTTDEMIPDTALTEYLFCCATGKCLLAHLEEAEVEALLQERTPGDIASNPAGARHQQMEELQSIRLRGIAYDRGEVIPGLRGVAAPVYDRSGEMVAALGIWTPVARWHLDGEQLTRAVRGTAARIAGTLHHSSAGVSPTIPMRTA